MPTVRDTDPQAVVLQGVEESTWGDFMQMLAEGVPTKEALDDLLVPQARYRDALSSDPTFRERVDTARALWTNRAWPEERLLDIAVKIAMGESLKEIVGDEIASFHALRMRETWVDEMYVKARIIQAEGYADAVSYTHLTLPTKRIV